MNDGDEFSSFQEFQDKLLQWSTATNTVWVKSHSKTVETANKKLSSKSKTFDQKFKFRNVLYRCKHGGAPRQTGRGLRPNQSSFKQDCQARLFLTVNKEKTKLVVQTLVTAHNHETSNNAFKHYPEQRRLSEAKKKEVETMLELGVKVKYLKEHIEAQQRQVITLKDLHNVHQKAKRERNGDKTEEELLMDELKKLCEDDPEAVISVQANNEGVLEFLLLVTGDMKQTFAMFPEVLMIDSTYCTNRLRMPLFSLLVEDGNGTGQTVGYAFITHETEHTLSAVMTEISRIHKLEKVKVVVLDKDMKEIAAVRKVIPGAEIQLCKFHVIQAVDRFIQKLSKPQEEKNDLKKSFQSLVFSKSKSAFERALCHLAATAPDSFMAYYNKNWGKPHQIKHWAFYKTIQQINLGNTTNNRMESHNQKIKDILKRNMTLTEAVKSILLLHRGKVNEMTHREFNHTFKTAYRLGDDDVVKDDLVKNITPYAAGILIAELEKARFSTSKNNKMCSCSLKKTMLLPCRHVFARRIEQGENIFNIDDVAESNDNMVPSPCTSESFQDWPSSLASLQSLSPTPLQDNPRELTPMPSSPFSFESNTPEKSTTPVPSPAEFKKDKSRTSTCSTGRATKILKDLKTIKLPKTPPVRGNVRLQKGKENVFQSRKRLLEKKRLNKKETNNESRHSKTNTSRSDEIDMIGDPKEMLTDVHINAAQKLLTQQFPKMHGLQDTILGSKLQFAIETGDFIQILHDGALHWLTISNLFCNDNCVDIFDSLYTSVSMDVKMQAACIMMIQEQTMDYQTIGKKKWGNVRNVRSGFTSRAFQFQRRCLKK
uniref:SWIM-type domain-containing protein n=1 Tax=Magallana gigas TaxID=29159 RepID=A0A8W8MAF0_MAGGI